MAFKKVTIDLKLVKEKLNGNLVALIQFPDELEAEKAITILSKNKRFVGLYSDDCLGLETIKDFELLYGNSIIYRIIDISLSYSSLKGKVIWKSLE